MRTYLLPEHSSKYDLRTMTSFHQNAFSGLAGGAVVDTDSFVVDCVPDPLKIDRCRRVSRYFANKVRKVKVSEGVVQGYVESIWCLVVRFRVWHAYIAPFEPCLFRLPRVRPEKRRRPPSPWCVRACHAGCCQRDEGHTLSSRCAEIVKCADGRVAKGPEKSLA